MNRAARCPVKFRRQDAGLEDLLHYLKKGLHNNILVEEGRVHEFAWRLVEIDLAEEWMIEGALPL
jgi:hypothetical protein